jgi:biopolymer transport protein ExbD
MEKKKAQAVVADINVTPMVDVMLVLLIIFMVITPMLTKGVSVDLVRTKNPIAMKDADKEDAILICVARDGGFWLSPGNVKIKTEDITGKVRDLQTNKLDKTVYVKADSRAKYGGVEEVVDNLRAAGVDQIGLITELIPDMSAPRGKPGSVNVNVNN